MNIIFLDCDGVLSLMPQRRKNTLEDGDHDFDRNYVEQLINLMKDCLLDPKIKEPIAIVISSSWRVGKTTKELQQIFKTRGFTFYESIIGKTGDSESRSSEILEWIKLNKHRIIIDKFVVIEDEEILIQDLPT